MQMPLVAPCPHLKRLHNAKRDRLRQHLGLNRRCDVNGQQAHRIRQLQAGCAMSDRPLYVLEAASGIARNNL
jgi:hypothetical protein